MPPVIAASFRRGDEDVAVALKALRLMTGEHTADIVEPDTVSDFK
jgi:hypothetical protein